MRLIRDKASFRVKYAGSTELELTSSGLIGPGFVDRTTTTANAEVVEAANLPDYFMGGMFEYRDGIWTGDQQYLEHAAAADKSAAEAGARARYGDLLSQLAAPYGPEERETWLVQESEARAWQSDNDAPCPMIRLMAANRGIDMDLMVQKILENAALFRAESGRLLGLQQKEIDQIYSDEV